ncbi:hypothetical protein CERSUDRAFT_114858 [Gelatoporia subvermispora B]|uniref:N-acetyltransferase domain-containing protein n=1 Tax=Ceriporiopsis subvermispora (strain B) TaxID=914234 RepID=M2RET6_CERS8|nr:hypothetical protein CERSUDRAFT_114858 [Gelatoporia subvermispora B]
MPAQNAYVRRLLNPSEDELQAAVEVLRAAFYGDTGMASLSEGSKRLETLLYRLTMRAALEHGEFHVAVVDGQIQGIALFIGPEYDWVSYEQPEFTNQLSQYGQEWYAHHYAPTYEELYRSAFLDGRQSRRDAWNLALLGINPPYQRQGLGRSLLAAVMSKVGYFAGAPIPLAYLSSNATGRLGSQTTHRERQESNYGAILPQPGIQPPVGEEFHFEGFHRIPAMVHGTRTHTPPICLVISPWLSWYFSASLFRRA